MPEAMAECRRLFNKGRSRSEVAEAVGVGKWNIDVAHQRLFPRVLSHPLAEPCRNRTAETILGHLNDAEYTNPGIDQRMVDALINADAPAQ